MGLWAAWASGRCPGLWLGFVMDDHFQAKPIYDLVLLPRFKLIMNFPSEPPLSSLSLWPPVHVIIVLHSMSVPHDVKEYKSKETKAAMPLSLFPLKCVFCLLCRCHEVLWTTAHTSGFQPVSAGTPFPGYRVRCVACLIQAITLDNCSHLVWP